MVISKRQTLWTALALTVAGATGAVAAYRIRRQRTRLNPATASSVDLRRYAGRWYEIARLPQRYERGATDVQAIYTPQRDGTVRIENIALKKGKEDSIIGTARAVSGSANTKLKVQFFWPFEGDYWILAVDEGYQWALVGNPDGDALWLLSRRPKIGTELRDHILAIARQRGYDVTKLMYTPQGTLDVAKELANAQ